MKHVVIISILVLIALFFMVNKETGNGKSQEPHLPIAQKYPWQVETLADGRTQVFGIILEETSLKEIDVILKSRPKVALFESEEGLSLEAYYQNINLGGLIGSFIFTLDAPEEELLRIKQASQKPERTETKGIRHELDLPATEQAKSLVVKHLVYIPTVQLDEKTIEERFGKAKYKIKLKNNVAGWHYLYPEKGLDLIYHEEGKEVLQYVLPKNFNALLEPLQSN